MMDAGSGPGLEPLARILEALTRIWGSGADVDPLAGVWSRWAGYDKSLLHTSLGTAAIFFSE